MRRKKPEKYTVEISKRFGNSKPYFIGYLYRGRKYIEFISGETEGDVIQKAKKRIALEAATEDYGTRTFDL